MPVVAQRLITADEFSRLPEQPDGAKQELVKGVIITMSAPGFRHGVCQVRISGILDAFVRKKKLGRVTTESGVRTDRKPDSVRGPDVAYWSAARLPLDETPVGYPKTPADLCVEILSPDDRPSEYRKKTREYLRNGVRIVWIVDPQDKTVTVYRKPDEGRLLSDDATITGESVLPGFKCRVADFFE